MSSRTVKFSDLLTRPVEFAPIEAPPSPSSQLDTLSTTESTSEEESVAMDAPAETLPPSDVPSEPAPNETALKIPPSTAPSTAFDSESKKKDAPEAAPPPTVSVEAPEGPSAAPPEGAVEQSPVPSPSGATGPSAPEAAPPQVSSSLSPETASPPDVSPPPPSAQPAEPTPVPPLPPMGSPGSVFNFPGLQTTFPMQATALPGFSLVPASEAEEAARRLGLAVPKNFSVPSATRLPDGSVVLAAPTTAVSMARVSASCSQALSDPAARPMTDEVLRLIDAFRRNPTDDAATAKLAQALRAVEKSQMLACDPALAGALGEARTYFGKLQAAVGRKTSSELTYMKHAEEFRAMKKDLKALSDVVQADGQAVAAAREKTESYKKKHLPQAARSLYVVMSRLRQLRDLSERLR